MRTYQQAMDDWNYYGDSRVQAQDRTKPIMASIPDPDGSGDWIEVELPSRWEVCDLCEGRGSHVNPSIDAGGFEPQDADDMEAYMSGAFDVTCNQCKGRTTVRVVDRERCDPEILAAFDEAEQEEYSFRQEQLAELRAGA